MPHRPLFTAILVLLAVPAAALRAGEYLTGVAWDEPAVVKPGEENHKPPSDAVVLFDGSSLDAWEGAESWKIEGDALVVGKRQIKTKQHFGDCQLHIEWSAPTPAKGKGQGRGNSGVFFMGRYEIQVLDSYQNKTYFDGQAGAIYKQTPPMANAMRPPGEWNTYDLFFTAPRFNEDGSLKSPAYLTAMHNGVLVQNHFELLGDTPYNRPPRYEKHPAKGPIALQDHGNPVRFRNIWVREIKPASGKKVREPNMPGGRVPAPAAAQASVSGSLTLEGEPLAGATITLHSAEGVAFSAKTDSDGRYDLSSPSGSYTVAIQSPKVDKASTASKFGSPATSGLTVTVLDRDNTIDIALE